MPVPCPHKGCTLDWNHKEPHSNDLRSGKRERKAIATYKEDDSEPVQQVRRISADVLARKAKVPSDEPVPQGRRVSANVLARKAKVRWKPIVPRKVKLPAGKPVYSAEVKFMTLSNSKTGSHGKYTYYRWGGAVTWTDSEKEAINAGRDDGDNIHSLFITCFDPRTADMYFFSHECDPKLHGVYKMNKTTFRALEPKAYPKHGFGVPARHRSVEALKGWLDTMETWCGAPPLAVIHCSPKGPMDDIFSKERPPMGSEVVHLYGLLTKEGDRELSQARKFLATRARIFDKPEIGDNFIATLQGKDTRARVKAFNALFDGGSNDAIGLLGEMIALDVLTKLGADAVQHPTRNHHYDLFYCSPGD